MRIGDAMRRLVPPGSLVLFLFFLTGIWLAISPFAMTTQPSGQHWTAATVNNVTLGTIMMVVSLLGILGCPRNHDKLPLRQQSCRLLGPAFWHDCIILPAHNQPWDPYMRKMLFNSILKRIPKRAGKSAQTCSQVIAYHDGKQRKRLARSIKQT